MSYGLALALTLALEVPLILWFSRTRPKGGAAEPFTARALAAVGANLFTHGLLWTLVPLSGASWALSVAVGELLVWWAEALAYAGLRLGTARQALLWSLLANALTTGVGLAHHAIR